MPIKRTKLPNRRSLFEPLSKRAGVPKQIRTAKTNVLETLRTHGKGTGRLSPRNPKFVPNNLLDSKKTKPRVAKPRVF